MVVKIVGKQHMQGTGKKSGKPYDFWALHYIHKTQRVQGDAVDTININVADSPFADAVLGSEYDLEFDKNGYVVNFAPVKKG